MTWSRAQLVRGRAGVTPICAPPGAARLEVHCADNSAVASLFGLPVAFDLRSDHLSQLTWNSRVTMRIWFSCINSTMIMALFFRSDKAA